MATQGTQDEKQQHTTPYVLDTSIRKQKQITWGKDKIIEYPDHKPLQAIIVRQSQNRYTNQLYYMLR